VILSEGESAGDIKAGPAGAEGEAAPRGERTKRRASLSRAQVRLRRPVPESKHEHDCRKAPKMVTMDNARSAARRHGPEEMRARCRRVRRGEEVADIRAASGHAGVCAGVRRRPRDRYPINEHGFAGGLPRRRWQGSSRCRVNDLQLRHAGDRPHHQSAPKTLYIRADQIGCEIVFAVEWSGAA